MGTELIIALLGVLVAAVAAYAGWLQGNRSAKVSERQFELDAHSYVAGWYNDFRAWASEAIDVMSEAIYLCGAEDDGNETCSAELRSCRYRLSSLIDRGKFFLPNERHESHGVHKSYAYRGFRHPALDYLVGAEQIIGGRIDVSEAGIKSRSAALVEMKRRFVSVTQMVLDPRGHLSRLDALLDESRRQDSASETSVTPLIERHYRDLDPTPQNPPLQADEELEPKRLGRTRSRS